MHSKISEKSESSEGDPLGTPKQHASPSGGSVGKSNSADPRKGALTPIEKKSDSPISDGLMTHEHRVPNKARKKQKWEDDSMELMSDK